MRPEVRHETPLAALETLDRELEAICDDVPRPGSNLGSRLETVLQLLPVVTEAAHAPQFASDRDATVATLQRMYERHEALAAALRLEMEKVRAELAQVNQTSRAARSYGTPAAQSGGGTLDRVG